MPVVQQTFYVYCAIRASRPPYKVSDFHRKNKALALRAVTLPAQGHIASVSGRGRMQTQVNVISTVSRVALAFHSTIPLRWHPHHRGLGPVVLEQPLSLSETTLEMSKVI
jgi:hypothetical protein